MGKRGRLARVAAVSNGMVWFGLSAFLAAIAVQMAPASFAGEWFHVLGWTMIVIAAVGLLAMGLVEQRTMRAARLKARSTP